VNFPRFTEEYRDCVDSAFDKYYAIARRFSKVTGDQFATFCKRIGAPAEPAPKAVRRLFARELIEDVFLVREYAFDADKLAARFQADMLAAGVIVRVDATATSVRPDGECLALSFDGGSSSQTITARHVFNCTYSLINMVLGASGLPTIPLKHEFTEMALVSVPEPVQAMGVTVMCGPFFSVMPFPARRLHSFSHVRYTPHYAWQDRAGAPPRNTGAAMSGGSNFMRMQRDAQRYMPILEECEYVDSLWETKTVLPSSEVDDSRPILFKRDHGLPNLTCIMGGKIDNIYDVLAELEHVRLQGGLA